MVWTSLRAGRLRFGSQARRQAQEAPTMRTATMQISEGALQETTSIPPYPWTHPYLVLRKGATTPCSFGGKS